MLSRSFFPNFGQGPFPKIAGKGPIGAEILQPKIYLENTKGSCMSANEAGHFYKSY